MLHKKNHRTGYEVAAMNSKTGQSIFVAVVRGSRSRGMLQRVLFTALAHPEKFGLKPKATRFDRINQLTGVDPQVWVWAKRSADGVTAGDWSVKLSGRTAMEVDQTSFDAKFTSIYDDDKVHAASLLGAKAFADGKTAVPALDPELVKLLKGNDVLPVLTAWTKAWHSANLAAPVPAFLQLEGNK